MSDDLAALAGGDEYELAAGEINSMVIAARDRLLADHVSFLAMEHGCLPPPTTR